LCRQLEVAKVNQAWAADRGSIAVPNRLAAIAVGENPKE